MLPTSHLSPSLATPNAAANGRDLLNTAFEGFLLAASEVESSYRALQKEVAGLREELEDRNRALSASLAETDNIRQSLHAILQTLPCGVLVAGSNQSRIVLINAEARRCLGIDCERQVTEVPEKLRTLPATTKSNIVETHEITIVESGTSRRIEIIRSTRGSGKVSVGNETIFILRDVTQQRELEEQKETARNFVALAEVSSVLAHEIRNPLAMLELFSTLLADLHQPGSEPYTWTQHLQAGIRSLGCTVNNVLRISNQSTPMKSALRLDEFIAAEVEFIRPLAEQASIGLEHIGGAGTVTIEADTTGLHQVFLNLAANALRHMSRGGKLSISTSTNSTGVAVRVSDTGSGIKPEDLPNIFKPGFSTGGGAGLGLAVCERIVAEHGGEIHVRSALGEGTTFLVEFPIHG